MMCGATCIKMKRHTIIVLSCRVAAVNPSDELSGEDLFPVPRRRREPDVRQLFFTDLHTVFRHRLTTAHTLRMVSIMYETAVGCILYYCKLRLITVTQLEFRMMLYESKSNVELLTESNALSMVHKNYVATQYVCPVFTKTKQYRLRLDRFWQMSR